MKGTERGSEMKKTLAILLSLALIVCMMPVATFASVSAPPALPENINPLEATLEKPTTVYNGQDQMPAVKVDGSTIDKSLVTWVKGKLDESDDLSAQEEVTSITNAGDYSVFLYGAGEYLGKVKVLNFTVTPYDLSKVVTSIDNQFKPSVGDFGLEDIASIKFYSNGNLISESVLKVLFGSDLSKLQKSLTAPTTTGGKYTVSFSVTDTVNFTGSIAPAKFSLVDNIYDSSIKIKKTATSEELASLAGGEYDGTSKNVSGLFSLYKDGSATPLRLGTDYTVEYSDAKSVGTHEVTIKGEGTYGGSRPINLVITRRDADKHVQANSIADQTEDTIDDIEPVLKDKSLGTTLKENEDYQILSRTGVAGGKGLIQIGFMGNYEGSTLSIPFNVVSDEKNVENSSLLVYYGATDITLGTLSASAFLYNASYQPLNNIVVYKDAAAYNAKTALSSSYYSLSYEYRDKNDKNVAVTSPIEAQDYDVYLVGKNGYAGKRYLGKYKIPKYNTSNVAVSVSMANAASVPTVTVKSKYENITFVKDKDYTFTHYVNTTTGKVYVSVYPTNYGNLTGTSISDYYPIIAKSITSCTATFTNGKSSAAYTGYNIPVDVTVKDGYYTPLSKGTHYKVTYKDAAGKTVTYIKDAGVYTVEIEGIGLYTGKLTLTFTVTGNDISGYTVTLKESSVNVSDKAQTPVIESVKKGTTTLASTNYTVSYQDATGKAVTSMKDPGTYKVVVTGKGAYSGSAYATFRIVGLTQTLTTEKSTYKVYKSSDAFNIEAESNVANAAVSYTSSNPSVANVSATGTVTVNKVGRAVITISAPVTGKYDAASTTVVVKVYPKKGAMSRSLWTDGKKKQIKVRWYYQDGATQYQIRYSRKSNFSTYATKRVTPYGDNKYTTNTATIKNLKSKTKYYVKVRAIYTDAATGEVYYGKWSTVKSITTK